MSRWLDRLSGQTFDTLPEGRRLPGRFFDLETQLSDEPNPVEPAADEYLGAPIDLEQARELESTVVGHTRWSFEALAASKPIVRTDDIDLHWNDRDAELANAVTLIERICRDPHTLLTTTTELEPVHRARRTRPTALAYLAAHTEDWLHRGVVRVRPRRVLAERRDTVLDVYENRLVARLIDRVLHLIQARLSKLERRAALYKEVAESLESAFANTDPTSPSWEWRAQRLCQLWGDETPDEARDQIARETQLRLEDIAARASACRASELYLSISRHAPMDREPHMTNVLRSERRYRQARKLWVDLAPSEAQLTPPRPTTDFMTFAAMLVVRALSQLNYNEPPDSSPERVIVDDGLGPIHLAPDHRGLVLWRNGELLVRFLSLPAALDSISHANLYEITRAVGPSAKDTVLLCWNPGSKLSATGRLSALTDAAPAFAGLAHDPRPLDLELGILPVSPWDLGSVERVARALRWYLLAPRYLAYPPKLSAPPDVLAPKPPATLQVSDGHLLSTSLDLASVETTLARLRADLKAAQQEAEDAHAEYQRARKAKREFAHFETQSDQAKRKAKDLNTSVHALEQWRDAFASALPIAAAVNRCPVCEKSGTLQRRDPTTFAFECDGCDTQWGVRACGSCGQRLPFIEPPRGTPSPDTPADRTFGQDVLAIFTARGSSTCARCGPRATPHHTDSHHTVSR